MKRVLSDSSWRQLAAQMQLGQYHSVDDLVAAGLRQLQPAAMIETQTDWLWSALYHARGVDWPHVPTDYTYQSLIVSYLEVSRQHFPSPELKQYANRMLETLQKLFGIDFTQPLPTLEQQVLLMVLTQALHRLMQLTTASGFLEAGLYFQVLEKHGEQGQGIILLHQKIDEIASQHIWATWQLVDHLFCAIWGKPQQIFSSADLLQLGFDDRNKPVVDLGDL
jgi:hypothetical protein